MRRSPSSRARSTRPTSRCARSTCRRASPTSPWAKSRWCGRRGARAPTASPRRPTTDHLRKVPGETMKELIDMLTKNLGVSGAQAEGGAAVLFKAAKDKLGEGEVGKLL